MRQRLISIIALTLLMLVGIVRASHAADDASVRTVELTLHAAEPATPVLKYGLKPDRQELKPGNAAGLYYRAILGLPRLLPTGGQGDADNSPNEQLIDLLDEKPSEMSMDEARHVLTFFHNSIQEATIGARRNRCEWDIPVAEEGFETLLSELQGIRMLTRALALQARVQTRQSNYAEVIETLQTGLTMARHVSRSGTLVSTLVGVACAKLMLTEADGLLQLPDAPNLYWAVLSLGDRFVDEPAALDSDMRWIEKYRIEQLAGGLISQQQAKQLASSMAEVMELLSEGSSSNNIIRTLVGPDEPLSRQMLFTLYSLNAYPVAKQRLIGRGYEGQMVEAMPVAQVVLLDIFERYASIMQQYSCAAELPYPAALRAIKIIQRDVRPWTSGGDAALLGSLVPVSRGVVVAAGILDRHLAQLAVIEAIRWQMARDGARLPASLDDVNVAVVPDDPLTGKPFRYHVEGDTATLEPAEAVANAYVRYRIKAAKSE